MRKNCLKYPVEFTTDIFDKGNGILVDTLRKVTGSDRPRVMLVADLNVVQHIQGLGTRIGAYITARDIDLVAKPTVIAGGEKIKCDNLRAALTIVSAALEAKIGADDVMLILGGGSLFDVAGWAAAQVRGGVKTVRIPTTPAAMIDAAFADNAALDSVNIKDALKVPCTPAAVLIDHGFAAGVLDGVWRGGFAAALRQSAVTDAGFFASLADTASVFRNRDLDALGEMVKKAYSSRTEHDVKPFGEWSALRLEAMSSYKLPHGYALSLGMLIDAQYARLQKLLSDEEFTAIEKALAESGAKEGSSHIRHLLDQDDVLLAGLSAWRLSHPEGVVFPKGIGRSVTVEIPDLATMKSALNMIN